MSASNDDTIPARSLSYKVFPNPARSKVRFRLQSDRIISTSVQIKIFDLLGRIVTSVRAGRPNEVVTIPVDGLPAGTYFYRIESDDMTATGILIVMGE